MKRIFTWGSAQSPTLPANETGDATTLDTFLAEEDVTIIGAELALHPPSTIAATDFISDDGVLAWEAELTPHAPQQWLDTGAILFEHAAEIWNTVPAAVQLENGHAVVMFPEGYGIPLKEEGIINLIFKGSNSTANAKRVVVDARLYYVKGIRSK